MSVIVSCPKCQRKLKIEDNVLGKNIRCPGCTAVFATKAPAGAAPPPAAPPPAPAPAPKKAPPPPDDDGENEAPRRPSKAAARDDDDDRPTKKSAAKAPRDDDDYDDDRPTKKSAAKKSRDDDYDDEDDRPKKSSKKGRDDDEDDRPAKKSAAKKGRDDDDEDDDDRPAKKAKKKGGAGKVVAIIVGVLFLLCAGCAGVAYYYINKAGQAISGAMTDLAVKMTAPENRFPTMQQGPGLPGSDTKKKAEGPGGKPDGQRSFASEQQLADAMVDNDVQAMRTYVGTLQLTGKVTRVTKAPDGKVNEIFFEPQVEDLKTHTKSPFPINCRLVVFVPAAKARVGSTVTVRGHLTGGGKTSATLNDCVVQ